MKTHKKIGLSVQNPIPCKFCETDTNENVSVHNADEAVFDLLEPNESACMVCWIQAVVKTHVEKLMKNAANH